jgi:hypothetical protein
VCSKGLQEQTFALAFYLPLCVRRPTLEGEKECAAAHILLFFILQLKGSFSARNGKISTLKRKDGRKKKKFCSIVCHASSVVCVPLLVHFASGPLKLTTCTILLTHIVRIMANAPLGVVYSLLKSVLLFYVGKLMLVI